MKFIPLFAAALLLTACSTINENTPAVNVEIFGPSQPVEKPQTVDEATLVKDLVASADRMEIGALNDGYMLTVFGHAPETGWFSPELRPRNAGLASPDGMLELNFIAAAPEKNGGVRGEVGTEQQRAIRADYQITRRALVGLKGVRIYTASGPIQGLF